MLQMLELASPRVDVRFLWGLDLPSGYTKGKHRVVPETPSSPSLGRRHLSVPLFSILLEKIPNS